MVNGPPTPPPTNAAELQDEQRGNPSSALPDTSDAEITQDEYRYILPTIEELASKGNFHDVILVAERSDLNGDGDHQSSRLLNTAPLILAYLIVDDLPPARYALTRLPDNLASLPLSQALLDLVASASERKHVKVYTRAESLFNLVSEPDFFDAKLASVIAEMVTTFVESFRNRTFALLSKAYTSLSLPLAQTYLGMNTDQLLAAAEKNEWSYDSSAHVLFPSTTANTPNHGINAFSSLSTFHFVATSVAKLEL